MTSEPLTISIERCTDPARAEDVARIGRETFVETFGHLYKPEDLQHYLETSHVPAAYAEMLVDARIAIWLATCGDEVVGFAVAAPCSLPVPDMPENSGELARLYLKGSTQGTGAGSKMLHFALDFLEQHFDHVYLSVYAENFGAQRLYERHGFQIIHEYNYMVGNHADPEFIMRLMKTV